MEQKPGKVYIGALDEWVDVRYWQMKSYYYGVQIPDTLDIDTEIPLFDGNIGDLEWTNMSRANYLPEGHYAAIYKVALSVKACPGTTLMDVFTALQYGSLALKFGCAEAVQEPLSAFPVNIYGEIVHRYDDPVAALGVSRALPTGKSGELLDPVVQRLKSVMIPTEIGDETYMGGSVTLRRGLNIGTGFVLYVSLYSITSAPLR